MTNEAASATYLVQPTRRTSDPVRRVARALIRVEMFGRNSSLPVPAWTERDEPKRHCKFNKGEERVTTRKVYVDDIPKLEALVETEHAAIEQAQRSCARKRQEWVKSKKGAKTEAEAPYTVEAEFHNITGRGFLPIVSLEVLDPNLPAPESDDDRLVKQQTEIMAQAIARAIQLGNETAPAPRRGRPPKNSNPEE